MQRKLVVENLRRIEKQEELPTNIYGSPVYFKARLLFSRHRSDVMGGCWQMANGVRRGERKPSSSSNLLLGQTGSHHGVPQKYSRILGGREKFDSIFEFRRDID